MPKQRSVRNLYGRLLPLLVLLGCIALSYYLLITTGIVGHRPQDQSNVMVQRLSDKGVIQRDKLAIAISMQPSTSRDQFFQLVGLPLGQLGDLKSKDLGVVNQYVYPLAFEPSADFVALFKDQKLVGYRWLFNRQLPE